MQNTASGTPPLQRALSLAVLLAGLGTNPAKADPEAAPIPSSYTLVVTGGELLTGAIQDAHTPFITRSLLPLGLHCDQVIVVDDTPTDLESALKQAASRSSLILTTGGLGPTANDLTRQALSRFNQIQLQESPVVLEELSRRFEKPAAELPENIRRQAAVPVQGGFLPNDRGTAVGLIFQSTQLTCVALPGPPRELQPMVEDHLVPWLRTRLGLPHEGPSLRIRFVGIGQSTIANTLSEHQLLPTNVVCTSTFEGGRVDFTFSLKEDSPAAQATLQSIQEGLTRHLGSHIYSTRTESLESVTWNAMKRAGESMVIAEAQQPLLASAFARALNHESTRLTSLSANNLTHLATLLQLPNSAPHTPRIQAIGSAARNLTRADWVIVVNESPAPGQPEHVLIGHPDGRWLDWEIPSKESPETGKPSLVNTVLNRLRLLE
jgi:molybdenum cofactor synthesis domain-containing protein